MATFLNPYIGYLEAAKLAKESLEKNISVKELVIQKGMLSKEEVEKIFNSKFFIGVKRNKSS